MKLKKATNIILIVKNENSRNREHRNDKNIRI